MKFDLDIGQEVVEKLAGKYPELPRGKTWIKYGKKRVYFNEKKDGVDYGFYIQFHPTYIEVSEIIDNYWFERLDISSKDELEDTVESIYYSVAYPIGDKLPATTVREIKQHRRLEGLVEIEEDIYHVEPLFLDIEVDLKKTEVEQIVDTPREKGGKSVTRIRLARESLDEVIDRLEELEDEADRLLMEKMTKSLGSSYALDD